MKITSMCMTIVMGALGDVRSISHTHRTLGTPVQQVGLAHQLARTNGAGAVSYVPYVPYVSTERGNVVHQVEPVPCVDKNIDCLGWAGKGFCTTGQFVTFMGQDCKRTCGKCGVSSAAQRSHGAKDVVFNRATSLPTNPPTPPPTNTPARLSMPTQLECDEYHTGEGTGYRGCQTVTRSGAVCQDWSSNVPHLHTDHPDTYPEAGLEVNYCRNPDGAEAIWCYTTDPDIRWDYCDPLVQNGSSCAANNEACSCKAILGCGWSTTDNGCVAGAYTSCDECACGDDDENKASLGKSSGSASGSGSGSASGKYSGKYSGSASGKYSGSASGSASGKYSGSASGSASGKYSGSTSGSTSGKYSGSTSGKSCTTEECDETPEPTGEGDTPEPTGEGDTPEPTGEGDTPEPTGEDETPEPTGEGDTPEPTGEGDTPEPTGEGDTPEPTGEGDTPEPTGEGDTPEPTGDALDSGSFESSSSEEGSSEEGSFESSSSEEESASSEEHREHIDKGDAHFNDGSGTKYTHKLTVEKEDHLVFTHKHTDEKETAGSAADPVNCPFNTGHELCWADTAYQQCPGDKETAYQNVADRFPDQQAMYIVFMAGCP